MTKVPQTKSLDIPKTKVKCQKAKYQKNYEVQLGYKKCKYQ